MKRNLIDFLIVMGWVAILTAATCRGAEATLEAPARIEVGQLLRLDSGDSVGDHFSWLVIPSSSDFYVENDVAFFSARAAGRYVFVLIVSDQDGIATDQSAVTVGEPGPGPNPVPDSLAEKVRKLSKGLPADERAVVGI